MEVYVIMFTKGHFNDFELTSVLGVHLNEQSARTAALNKINESYIERPNVNKTAVA
jgi:hypothetical protein